MSALDQAGLKAEDCSLPYALCLCKGPPGLRNRMCEGLSPGGLEKRFARGEGGGWKSGSNITGLFQDSPLT